MCYTLNIHYYLFVTGQIFVLALHMFEIIQHTKHVLEIEMK